MPSYRTTLILDDESRRAARELALRYDCSLSEAIRRAVVLHRDPAQDHWTAHSAWQRGYVGVSIARVDEIWFALGLAGSPP